MTELLSVPWPSFYRFRFVCILSPGCQCYCSSLLNSYSSQAKDTMSLPLGFGDDITVDAKFTI